MLILGQKFKDLVDVKDEEKIFDWVTTCSSAVCDSNQNWMYMLKYKVVAVIFFII